MADSSTTKRTGRTTPGPSAGTSGRGTTTGTPAGSAAAEELEHIPADFATDGAADSDAEPFGSARARARALAAANDEDPDAEEPRDWGRIGLFGAGIALGFAIGAGLTLLYAPASGSEMRDRLRRRARKLRGKAGDAWDDLGDELRMAARRRRRKARRAVTRGKWAAQDALD